MCCEKATEGEICQGLRVTSPREKLKQFQEQSAENADSRRDGSNFVGLTQMGLGAHDSCLSSNLQAAMHVAWGIERLGHVI